MASTKLRETALNSPKLLYKFLLRECKRLPKNAQEFYKHSIKQVNSIDMLNESNAITTCTRAHT